MKIRFLIFTAIVLSCLGLLSPCQGQGLEDGFVDPPDATKPWCYWYWISDNISKEGVTQDLEAMARVGIGEALIGNIFLDEVPHGEIQLLSEEWWELVEHAVREGERVGVNIGLFNCPGWSMSGGPWVGPGETMRYLTSSETRVTGPRAFDNVLPVPATHFQDVAVLAFPAPASDGQGLPSQTVDISTVPVVEGAELLVDGQKETALVFPETTTLDIDLEFHEPFVARVVQVVPADHPCSMDVELLAENEDGNFESIRTFRCDWNYLATSVGFIPQAPVSISFPAVESRQFRLRLTNIAPGHRNFIPSTGVSLAEINLSGEARLELFVEKQLGKMLPLPLPDWATYMWPVPAEPDDSRLIVPEDDIRDISRYLTAEGVLQWDVPPGDWIILRTGMTPTGMSNAPASPQGRGFEIDKMNPDLAAHHFDSFVGELLRRIPKSERTALKRVVADSYEVGAQNWTDGFERTFQARYGYDPAPWLPVLTGRMVGSADQSERFLWDLRRLIADEVATGYVGGLREACRENGLGLWLENYGHWGYPGEFLKYGGECDRIGGGSWVTGNLGSIECRAASSCANTYGKRFVSAESWTGGPAFRSAPWSLRARGDWSFCEGVNHVVLHVYIQQPWNDKMPGVNAPWGTEFNRHNTWFEDATEWIEYLRRSSWMLQQGHRVADVAYFIGEDAPKMTGIREPELPAGYDFDYINAEVIRTALRTKKGDLVLPHGTRYRVLVLPPQDSMRPEVLKRIRGFVKAGATVVGPAPTRSPSLQGYPNADETVRKLAADLWGEEPGESGNRQVGKGRVMWGKSLTEVFTELGLAPDVEFRDHSQDTKLLFTHRSAPSGEIYFISNQRDRREEVQAIFRVSGRTPELWDAVDGTRQSVISAQEDGRTVVPLNLAPYQSVFVVFPERDGPPVEDAPVMPTDTLVTLDGPWDISFEPGSGAPGLTTFERLTDWTTHDDPNIRFFSGSALYRHTFNLDDPPAGPVWIDLGDVRDLAKVRLNGNSVGNLWTAPWAVEVTDALQSGENVLEIEIVNVWNNRLVGDVPLSPEDRRTRLLFQSVTSETPLVPAGLLGPVNLLAPSGAGG